MEFIEAQTVAGRVRGARRAGSIAFLGIPFAEPPVGELRFAAPVPAVPWQGVRDALEFAPTAQRGGNLDEMLIPEKSVVGDSTLNVNVFTPDLAASLPVLVFIHGGAYVAGSPASDWYDGAAFNRDGIVTVTLSYRLGFDGFGFIEDAPHNRAVRDWLLGLEWVRDNISAFGGDPTRVTLVGQSAGAGAVLTLLGMPAAQHLFHAAYAMSPVIGEVSVERAKSIASRLAAAGGVTATRAGLLTLGEKKVLALQDKVAKIGGGGGGPIARLRRMLDDGFPFAPLIDGDLVPVGTLEAIRSGIGADKPLVLGAADDEFSMVFNGPAAEKLKYVPASVLIGQLGLKGSGLRSYRWANRRLRGTVAILGRYVSDRMFRAGTLAATEARGAAPTWLYRFAWRSPVHRYAIHCLDVPFFFDGLGRERVSRLAGKHPPQSLADDVHGAAVRFVRDGEPGWERYERSGATKVFDVPSALEKHGFEAARAVLR